MLIGNEESLTSLKASFIKQIENANLSFISEDRITIGRRIGWGGFSVVYKAKLTEEGNAESKCVAYKELKPKRVSFQTQLNALIHEATLLRKIQHPSIVGCIGCGLSISEQPTLFMVQEMIKGESLDGYMEGLRRSRMPYEPRKCYSLRSALRWCIQAASAVSYLHSKGNEVIHRDIKLSNLLLTRGNLTNADVKLVDFGLAVDMTKIECSKNPQVHNSSTNSSQSTKYWWNFFLYKKPANTASDHDLTDEAELCGSYYDLSQQVGSYLYMSPEVFLGVPYNEKADIYSLGIVLLEILIGKPLSCCVLPNRNYNEAKNFAYCVSRGLRLKCPRAFPKTLASVLERCWQFNSWERPTATEVMEVFQSYNASCMNAENLFLFPPVSLSCWQKFNISSGKASRNII
eukprot:g3341.t1